MLPKESPPVCAREVSNECSRRQAHPSLLPLHHAPSNERRLFTSNPVIVPAGEGDILTSSHSFLLLWKIKVKKTSPSTSYCSISWGLASPTTGEEREEKAQNRDVPWTSHHLWITFKCFLLLCNDQRNEADVGVCCFFFFLNFIW